MIVEDVEKGIIICEKCKQHFEMVVEDKLIADDTQIQVFFECPHCKAYYPIFRTNKEIEDTKHNMDEVLSNAIIQSSKKNDKEVESLVKIYQTMNKKKCSLMRMLNKF